MTTQLFEDGIEAFQDGLKSMVSSLANSRSASARNRIDSDRLTWADMNEIYKTGLGNKIVRLKAGDAVSEGSFEFEKSEDQEFFDKRLARLVRRAVKWQLAFGRSVIVIQDYGNTLNSPLPSSLEDKRLLFRPFAGDMVTAYSPNVNLESPRYMMPEYYYIRGATVHHSRVIDFTYIEPSEWELPLYQYGGISEFELIYQQLINDGVIERAVPTLLEKSSNFFYKVSGFKDLIRQGNESDVIKYFQLIEDQRSIYGAGIVDSEDEVMSIAQSFQNLDKADQTSLRRISMVTGISLPRLVGENVRGLNSSGENEQQSDNATINALRNDYVLPPLQDLFWKLGRGEIWSSDRWSETPGEKADYESKVLNNAAMLYDLGADHEAYLEEKGLLQKDSWDKVFPEQEGELEPPEVDADQSLSEMVQEIGGGEE
jgi:hypothetical protein